MISISEVYAVESNKSFTNKKGYFYIQISGNGKTTKQRIDVTLSSLDKTKEQSLTLKASNASRIF